jgi:hypothetical protein
MPGKASHFEFQAQHRCPCRSRPCQGPGDCNGAYHRPQRQGTLCSSQARQFLKERPRPGAGYLPRPGGPGSVGDAPCFLGNTPVAGPYRSGAGTLHHQRPGTAYRRRFSPPRPFAGTDRRLSAARPPHPERPLIGPGCRPQPFSSEFPQPVRAAVSE